AARLDVEPLLGRSRDACPACVVFGRLGGIVGEQVSVALGLRRRLALGEAVVHRDRVLVRLVAVQLRRLLDDVLGDGEPHDLLAVVHVDEGLRDEVLRLPERAMLDDDVVADRADHVAQLVLVARDDVVAFHGPRCTSPRRLTNLRLGIASGRRAFRPSVENALLGWPAMSETTPETEARRLATEARDRVRFEEDALALAD